MTIHELLVPELEEEANITETFLQALPADKFAWKPHEKSMTMGQLANHILELFDWIPITMNQDEFQLADYQPSQLDTLQALIDQLHALLPIALAAVRKDDAVYQEMWTLKNHDTVMMQMPRYNMLRSGVMNQVPHHRAQLGVYLRLLDVPVPASYGPSADMQ